MTRRQGIIIAIVAAIAFAVVYFWPETARAGVAGRLHLGDGGVRIGVQIGDGHRWKNGPRWKRRRHGHHGEWRRWPRPGGRATLPPRGPVLVVPYAVSAERVIIRETVVAPPPAPVAVRQAAPPEPPDPQGRARTVAARGAEAPREWVLGAALPPDLPHVALAPGTYGLPQPPPGQIYARVNGDVLRIEAGSRRIVAVVSR